MADQVKLTPAEGISVAWDTDAVRALATDESRAASCVAPGGRPRPGVQRPACGLGATADGTLLLLCAARPEAAAHHDEEAVAAVLVSPEGEPEAVEEALVSTEYAADGAIRRLGLELYKEGDDYPVRGAGDATDTGAAEADGERRDEAELAFRLDGSAGAALYEIVHPA